jgi:flagellar biosynthesis protein FliQ
VIVYGSAIADEAAGWLVLFVHPGFAYFKIAAFITLEISLVALIVVVIVSLLQARRRLS